MSIEDYGEILRNVLVTQPCLNGAVGQPSLLISGLYIGGQRTAESYPTLDRMGVTHVLNCAGYKGHRTYKGSPYEGLDIQYLEFLADDTDHYDITQHFKEAFAFIDRARKTGGVVLVHCALGINRSGATCLGYLMLMQRMNIIKASIFIKSKRRVFLSNVGFQKRLVKLANKNGLLDDLESAYVQRFVTTKHKHRSNSVASYHHRSLEQFFPHLHTKTFDSSFNNYPIENLSHISASHQPFHTLILKDNSAYTHTKPKSLRANEILESGNVNGYTLHKAPRQSRIISLSRNSLCYL